MQTIIDENELLINEVNYIYKSLFRKYPTKTLPKIVIDQYILANKKLLLKSNSDRSVDINLIMSKKLDIEAIEMVTRGSTSSDLSKKFHILFFLLEVRADYYECFTNEKRTFFKAFILMGFYTLRSVFKFLIGHYLIRRYNVI
jgi:hypothetical protein